MSVDELADLIGASLTRHVADRSMWSTVAGVPGVRVRKLAAAVAADIEGKVLSGSTDSD